MLLYIIYDKQRIMHGKLRRLIERLFILLLGLILLNFIVRQLFPWLNQRLPLLLALFLVYLITAYLLLPALIRIARLFWRPLHIPAFTYTGDGWQVDPVNIGIVATEEEFVAAMQQAGWYKAEPKTLRRMWKMGLCILLHRPYHNAPMGTHYLFGRGQDYGFEIPITKSPHQRHHVRFWACVPVENPTFKAHLAFWQERHSRQVKDRKLLWVGAATRDIGLAVKKRNLQIDHNIEADAGKERDFIIATLKKSGRLGEVKVVRSHKPYFARHQTFLTRLIADGNIKICELT
ncbi:MAG TPA: LssY C-terminal domain-containing protein [Candidatus Saccharimonadales bacterium]|nr:LssY C-terminal domain-containing protein [Candidatus Saccharimonadales bacterium]